MNTKVEPRARTFRFLMRATMLHVLTYLVVGIVASIVLDYASLFARPVIRDYMVEFGSVSLFIGPVIQVFRGIIIAAVLLPFREIFAQRLGWLWLWLILVGIGILSTSAAAPSSIEGITYTQLPLWYHAIGMPEMLVQTLTFSVLVALYERHPEGLLAGLPPVFERLARALVSASLAFVGYALISVVFAVLSGATIDAEQSLSVQVQGLFVGPFLINFALAFIAAGGLTPARRIIVGVGSYVLSAAMILTYQTIFLSIPNIVYASVAPILPAVMVWMLVPNRERAEPNPPTISATQRDLR
ncbi:hypothetical protein [Paeniglutamicibacter psychrophenolicus]|uniref:hypothetical protein n=1 Tax=Paeniglutamicibacter psychrophenolicus TaxID=257454 RepID=UPI002788E9A0|nr:hypothetical protein [Paeniglutamicibacter psychrophenolicus]MDQ0092483.1 hypothetical protein [Paeniglutamicibacter psychrophenolicus]